MTQRITVKQLREYLATCPDDAEIITSTRGMTKAKYAVSAVSTTYEGKIPYVFILAQENWPK